METNIIYSKFLGLCDLLRRGGEGVSISYYTAYGIGISLNNDLEMKWREVVMVQIHVVF
jgi:hypothetical protein